MPASRVIPIVLVPFMPRVNDRPTSALQRQRPVAIHVILTSGILCMVVTGLFAFSTDTENDDWK